MADDDQHLAVDNPYDIRKSSFVNAGASIGHMSDYKSNTGAPPNQPQELPELDLDIGNDGDADDNGNEDWDYKDFAGAKVGSAAVNTRPRFDINNLGNSFDDDDDLLWIVTTKSSNRENQDY